MHKGLVRIPEHLAPSLVQALQDSGRLTSRPSGHPVLLDGTIEGLALRVHADGRIEFDDGPEGRALLIQCIKGILPTSEVSFLVGADESGMGGEAAAPVAALVLIPADARAELLVAGVSDSKKVAESRLSALAEIVTKYAMRWQILPVAAGGGSHAKAVAKAIAAGLLEWDDQGFLPANAKVTIDQTDVQALEAGFGENWARFKGRIEVLQKADEEYVEVAAASILARSSTVAPTTKPASHTKAVGVFHIGKWESRDRDQVIQYLHNLQRSYPDIAKWIGKVGEPKAVWTKVENGDFHLLVARMDNEVAGFCLSQAKDKRNWKLSTFFVAHAYRGQKIGHRLLDLELRRLADAQVRRVMVTFGHEEFQVMWEFFREHGFRVDGISPQRYRDNSYEVIMGKRFRYGRVQENEFQAFAEHDLFRMQGFNIKRLDSRSFLALPTPSLVQGPATKAARLLVRVTTSSQPEQEIDAVREAAQKNSAAPVLVSTYGHPSDRPLPSDVEIVDALVLERLFFPVQLDRPQDSDVVIPIRPEYAKILFPDVRQSTLMPTKVGLRTTNVYYRIAKNHEGLRRGARAFFYESEGKGVFGVAQLESVIAGSPKKIHAQTRGLGAWSLAQIAEHSEGKDVAAYRICSFRVLTKPQSLDQVKAMHGSFNPITAYRIPRSVGDAILNAGGIS